MNVCSLEWLFCLLLASAGFFLLRSVRAKQLVLALCNFGFLATQIADGRAWIVLALFLTSGYLVARLLQTYPHRAIFIGYLLVLVIAFAYLKQYAFLKAIVPASLFGRAVAVVGLSYLLFRQIHVLVDAMQDQIVSLTFWNYLNYQLNLFGLLAGPIQRYQDFCNDWMTLTPILHDASGILKAYLRVFVGVIKIVLMAPPCLWAFDTLASQFTHTRPAWKTAVEFLLLLYLFPIYLYFNFSGYCDMVIGGARLFGLRMPENFNYPFISRNLNDFWTRWHRTLGFWIRDYLFTPLFKLGAERWSSHVIALSFFCYFGAFFIAGIWHGSTWNFAIFGLLQGLGVSIAKAWEMLLTRRFGRQWFKRYLQSAKIRMLAVLANFHYVCLTVLFFPTDLNRSLSILKHLVGLA